MTPITRWFKKIWFFKGEQNDEIDKLIKEHQELTKRTDEALTRMIAALDGETGWFECSCVEKDKEKIK